jgi:hypothetical protein
MRKILKIKLKDRKGVIDNKEAFFLSNEDILEINFEIDDLTLYENKWFYSLNTYKINTTKELKDFKLELTLKDVKDEVIDFKIIMKDPSELYPEEFVIEPIKINKIFVIGKELDKAYPNKIVEIDDEIKNLKMAIVALNERIKNLEAETDTI